MQKVSPPTLSKDPSWFSLLLVNLLTMIFAVVQSWSLGEVLWVYWWQSVIIGVFQFYKILGLQNFSTKNFKINGRSVEATAATRRWVAGFFAVHYGFFHLVYMIFLFGLSTSRETSILAVMVCVAAFFINHLFSFLYNRAADRQRPQNIGMVMFAPYGRIIPMHLIIVFGFAIAAQAETVVLLFFLGLKTALDLVCHTFGHRIRARVEAGGV